MKLEREAVLHIAKLARVALSEQEIETFSEQLSEIITHFDVLSTVDTEGVEPTAHTLPIRNIFADDVSRASMPQDEVLALAPNTEDGYLRVRAVLE
ncbi:MAG: Asp-tRNA(Asn)/Glu-tRNA(Gln) amidotransferase subunit GatC [Chloroflexota bacterium]|nr:Asp-tRNA(Asn)/Glu-tRNA(Gln) amidotransferase subunit GatC [Chloroflexota bacterium]